MRGEWSEKDGTAARTSPKAHPILDDEGADLEALRNPQQTYSDEELLEQMNAVAERFGACTTELFDDDEQVAAVQTVVDRFGSWAAAKEQVGLGE